MNFGDMSGLLPVDIAYGATTNGDASKGGESSGTTTASRFNYSTFMAVDAISDLVVGGLAGLAAYAALSETDWGRVYDESAKDYSTSDVSKYKCGGAAFVVGGFTFAALFVKDYFGSSAVKALQANLDDLAAKVNDDHGIKHPVTSHDFGLDHSVGYSVMENVDPFFAG